MILLMQSGGMMRLARGNLRSAKIPPIFVQRAENRDRVDVEGRPIISDFAGGSAVANTGPPATRQGAGRSKAHESSSSPYLLQVLAYSPM